MGTSQIETNLNGSEECYVAAKTTEKNNKSYKPKPQLLFVLWICPSRK